MIKKLFTWLGTIIKSLLKGVHSLITDYEWDWSIYKVTGIVSLGILLAFVGKLITAGGLLQTIAYGVGCVYFGILTFLLLRLALTEDRVQADAKTKAAADK